MGAAAPVTITLCICGQPQEHASHAPGGHDFIPSFLLGSVRPTQQYTKGLRPNHFSLREPRIVVVAKPAAGVDVKATVPTAARWEVWGLRASLTTDAVVANRVPHLQVTDGPNGNVALDLPATNNQPAGATIKYAAAAGGVGSNFDNTLVFVTPIEMDLLQNWTIGFSTTALDPGDQWTSLILLVTETVYF